MDFYEEGEYEKAEQVFRMEIENGDWTHCLAYADILLRDLDGKGTDRDGAATNYLCAAEIGDGDAIAYLNSVSERLIEEDVPLETKKDILIKHWIRVPSDSQEKVE